MNLAPGHLDTRFITNHYISGHVLPAIICWRYSVFLSVRACLRPPVRDHILKVCEHDSLQTACGTTFLPISCSWHRDKLVRYWRLKVRGQGSEDIKCGQKQHFGNFKGDACVQTSRLQTASPIYWIARPICFCKKNNTKTFCVIVKSCSDFRLRNRK